MERGLDGLPQIRKTELAFLTRRALLGRSAALVLTAPAVAGLLAACSQAPAQPAPTAVQQAAATVAPAQSTTAPAPAAATKPVAQAPAATPAASGETPKRGGTFVGVAGKDPSTLNINITTDINASYAGSGLYSGLIELDHDNNVLPDLATSWTASPDGLRYEFKLADAKFHDGSPVTSDDVKYTVMEVAGKYRAYSATAFAVVDHVDTPDPRTVVFTLKGPSATFLMSLGLANIGILPRKLYDGTDPRNNPNNEKPVGSGPYVFKEWLKGGHVTLTRNPSYFKAGFPYLDNFITRVVPDGGSRTLAFQKGDIDFLPGQLVAHEQIPELRKIPGVQVDDHAGAPGQEILEFNLTRKPLDDIRVRMALAHAINQQAVVDKAYFGAGAFVSTSHVMTDLKPFHDPSIQLPKYDIAAANEQLDQAGYPKGPDGVRMRLSLAFDPSSDITRRACEVVRDSLKDAAVAVDLTPMDSATVGREVFQNGNFDLFDSSLTSKGDPDLGVARFFVSSSIGIAFGNGSRYSNPEIDQLFAQGGSTIDVNARKDIYYKAQAILAKDLPTFPLVDYTNIDFARPEVGGAFQTLFYYYRNEVLWRRQ